MRKLLIILCSFTLLLGACTKDEIPVSRADRGNLIDTTLNLGVNYKNQIWYKLNGNRIISTNSRSDWDMEFEAGDNGNHIRLNSAKFMFGLNTHKLTFAEVMDTTGFDFNNSKQFDHVATLDSSVIGKFEEHSTVFIIDLGYDDDNKHIGFKKIQFDTNRNTVFYFHYANLDGTDLHTASFHKSNNYNFIQYSFKDNILNPNIEPPKSDYDLEFTQYIGEEVQNGVIFPYWVCGILLNRSYVTACCIDGAPFESVTLKDTLQHHLTNRLDVIGYKWKYWDGSNYIYPIKTYILKDVEGFYYKMRFITFENAGIKGLPTFEYQKL